MKAEPKNTDMKEPAQMKSWEKAAHWAAVDLQKKLPGWTVRTTDRDGVYVELQGRFKTVLTISGWQDDKGRRKIGFLSPMIGPGPLKSPRAAYISEATLERFAAYFLVRKERADLQQIAN